MIKKEYVELLTFSVNKSNDFSIDLKESPTNRLALIMTLVISSFFVPDFLYNSRH